MTTPSSQLRVDYKPGGEAHIHAVRAPRVRRRFWVLLALAVTTGGTFQLFGMSVAHAGHNNQIAANPSVLAATVVAPAAVPAQAAASVAVSNPPAATTATLATVAGAETLQLTVHRGDTLGHLLAVHDLNVSDLHAIMAAGGDTSRLKQIHPGQIISISHDDSGRILVLNMKLDAAHVLEVTRDANGYRAAVADVPTDTSIAYAHGVIENSVFDASSRAGLDDSVTMQLIHLFAWDIDFAHDIRSGDSFTLLYQKIHRQGEPATDGPILAAEFVTPGKTYRIVRFTDPAGHTDYYTPDGHSIRKTLLRAPVAYTRISSEFSLHRMNPVLHFVRPHYGVDYAAPTGTPIVSAGDGRIVFRGRKEGFGRCVIINHGDGYSTLYAHMSRFNSKLHVGNRVKQDQVIGYVGESGEATGPHLHYQIMVDGVPRNPRTVKLPSADPILAQYRPEFSRSLDTLLAELSNGGETRIATTAANSAGKVTTAH
ncbi:MAG: peptidoglycan DD-metalloendopeptidase family protein [Gammaproteobacteria bacterium]